jgi:hypothetical protein
MEDWEQRLLSIEPRLENWKRNVEREFARVCKERRLRGFLKKPRAEDLAAAWTEARQRAGTEVLTEITGLFDAICDYYPTVLPQERAKIRARVGSSEVAFELFWDFVESSPDSIRSPKDAGRVDRALTAVVIDDLRADLGQVNEVLGRLVLAATAAGIEWRPRLAAAATVANRGTGGGGAHMREHLEEFERSKYFKQVVAPNVSAAAREAMMRGVESRAS